MRSDLRRRRETSRIDWTRVARSAREPAAENDHRPLVRLPAGTGLPRPSREIADEVGAYLSVTWRTFAGLVAGLHPSRAIRDVVATTIHKTLGGPRSGISVS